MSRYVYETVSDMPTLMTFNVRWSSAEQQTRNGWLRRGWVMDDEGRVAIAKIVEFNGPERPDGEVVGLFTVQEIVDTTGQVDPQTSYILQG